MIPVCHPGRVHFRSGQCRECWQVDRVLQRIQEPPPRIAGVLQHALKRLPEECPHCGAKGNALRMDGRLVECFQCGWTGYFTNQKWVKFTFSESYPRRFNEQEDLA